LYHTSGEEDLVRSTGFTPFSSFLPKSEAYLSLKLNVFSLSLSQKEYNSSRKKTFDRLFPTPPSQHQQQEENTPYYSPSMFTTVFFFLDAVITNSRSKNKKIKDGHQEEDGSIVSAWLHFTIE
jgi:hypothetical protein